MIRNITVLFLVILTLFASTAAARAQEQSTAPGQAVIASEIRNLATSVDRLTALLEKQAVAAQHDTVLRKLDIAIAYLNLRSRRIMMLERDIDSARSSKERMEDVLKQWDFREEQLEEKAQNHTGADAQEISQTRENIQLQRRIISERMAKIDGEVIELQNRILELQYQIDSVESFVQRNLEL